MTNPFYPDKPGLAKRKSDSASADRDYQIKKYLKDKDTDKAEAKKKSTARALQRMRDALKRKGMSEKQDIPLPPSGYSKRPSDKIAD